MRRTILRATVASAGILIGLAAGVSPAHAQTCPAGTVVTPTILGLKYCAMPAFTAVVAAHRDQVRADVRARRAAGKLIVYASTPISPRGGGDMPVNFEIAASVKLRLEKEFGTGIWVLNPGAYELPDVGGKPAGGGDYMVSWTDVLSGEDGLGRDFDMFHFTGPRDMRAFFGCTGDDVTGCLGRWIDARAARDARFKKDVADNAAARAGFVRYYAFRASAGYSTGAHDEWNIVVRLNRKRRLGDQIAVFFDGRPLSPAEMEAEVTPGYELR